MADVLRCANPACERPIERRPTGRPAVYCGPACRQAARRERLRLAEAERQRAEGLGADLAVPDEYSGAAQAAVLRAAYQAASIAHEVVGATAPPVSKQLTARAGRQGSPDGEAGQPASIPGIGDAGDASGAPPGPGTQAPRAWPPWAWTLA